MSAPDRALCWHTAVTQQHALHHTSSPALQYQQAFFSARSSKNIQAQGSVADVLQAEVTLPLCAKGNGELVRF